MKRSKTEMASKDTFCNFPNSHLKQNTFSPIWLMHTTLYFANWDLIVSEIEGWSRRLWRWLSPFRILRFLSMMWLVVLYGLLAHHFEYFNSHPWCDKSSYGLLAVKKTLRWALQAPGLQKSCKSIAVPMLYQ